MGVTYHVLLWNDLPDDLRDEWREELADVSHLTFALANSWPSFCQLRMVIDSLTGYQVEYQESSSLWEANVQSTMDAGTYADVVARDFTGDLDEYARFFFVKGTLHLNLEIARRIAGIVGSLIIVPSDLGKPIVISQDSDISDIIHRNWSTA